MKFDMGEAWSQAMAMLSANRQLIAIVAGVFFFLPYLALMLMTPDMATELPEPQPGADPQVMIDAFLAVYARIWPGLLAIAALQTLGSLSLLALLGDSTRPTLGEALKLGAIAFLPYIAAQLMAGIAMALLLVVLVGGGGVIATALGVVAAFVALVGLVYIAVKVSLAMPVIAIDRVYNPVAALQRSWRLTKGNSLRLCLFYFLIVVAGMIVVMIVEMVFGLLFALFGQEVQTIGNGIVSSALNAAWATLLLAVVAAAYRQLAGSDNRNP